ncbi:MAG: RNA polymerase sigma factor [Actinomycetota bacterium]
MTGGEKGTRRPIRWREGVFREVYSRYLKPVRAYIFRRVGNHHDAEDLAAEAFARALKHLEEKEADSPELAGWLFKAARNLSSNHRRSTRRIVISMEEVSDSAPEASPDAKAIDNEEVERLVKAISELPAEKRRALVLRFVDELSHSEVGEQLGRTENSTRVLLHRTLSDLKKEVS